MPNVIKSTTYMVILLLSITVFLFLVSSCREENYRDYLFPALQSYEDGGIAVSYGVTETDGETDLYLRRLNIEGSPEWSRDLSVWKGGITGGNPVYMTDDDNGGSLIAWKGGLVERQVTLVRVNQEGNILWEYESDRLTDVRDIVGDGAGGAIVTDVETNLVKLARINSQGEMVWSREIQVPYYVERRGTFRLIGVGDGGAILVKRIMSDGAGPGVTGESEFSIVAQRIDSLGGDLWGQDGRILYTGSENVVLGGMVCDGSDGAIVVWTENDVIYTQRIDQYGTALWSENGNVVISSSSGDAGSTITAAPPADIALAGDGRGNAIVLWESHLSIFVQKLNPSGHTVWQNGGVQVMTGDPSAGIITSALVCTPEGNAVITWASVTENGRTLFAQKIDASGSKVWGNVVSVTSQKKVYPFRITVCGDQAGGLLVVWGIGKESHDVQEFYIQRINDEGESLWGKNGILLYDGDG